MSSGIKLETGNMMSHSMNRNSRPRHTPVIQDLSSLARKIQDDDISSQDHYSLSGLQHTSQDMDQWTLSTSDSMESSPVVTQPDTPDLQMLSYSFSSQLLPTSGTSDTAVMFPSLSDIQTVGAVGNHGELDFSQAQHFSQAFSSMVDFSFDEGAQGCMHDDTASLGHSSHHEDGHIVSGRETWNMSVDSGNYPAATYDQLNHGLPAPVSPPLTEASHVSVSSAYAFQGYDDGLLTDTVSATVSGQNLNLVDSFFPLTPPLNDQDPNRTIRPSKHAQRPLLSASTSISRKSDPEVFASLPLREPARRTKDNTEIKTPRNDPLYSLPTQSDGKYYCPFANGPNPCNHQPTTQKCAYHKYLDSHLRPYRCRVTECAGQDLRFSSNACLFRHEREAHGFHGHGDNPHLCHFEGCDRAVPGYGFPRRWNLYDHMKRVHDFTASEQASSPEATSGTGPSKKKDSAIRKRKVSKTIGAQAMKRTRSISSQGSALKAHTAQHGQKVQNAERNYYSCRSRLLEELGNITPQDSSMHEKVNASLQELITLGLNYRQLEASSATTQLANGACV